MKVILAMCLVLSSVAISKPVLMVGDSIFALSRGVAGHLEATGLQVDDQSIVGAKMPDIAIQYESYDQIPEVIVLNGGGNDILLGHRKDCIAQNSKCDEAVQEAIGLGERLMRQMAEDGVETIIYVGLYHLGSFNRGLNPAIDAGMKQVDEACASINGCQFIDSREFITSSDLRWDGVHPNGSGSQKIGQAVSSSLQ